MKEEKKSWEREKKKDFQKNKEIPKKTKRTLPEKKGAKMEAHPRIAKLRALTSENLKPLFERFSQFMDYDSLYNITQKNNMLLNRQLAFAATLLLYNVEAFSLDSLQKLDDALTPKDGFLEPQPMLLSLFGEELYRNTHEALGQLITIHAARIAGDRGIALKSPFEPSHILPQVFALFSDILFSFFFCEIVLKPKDSEVDLDFFHTCMVTLLTPAFMLTRRGCEQDGLEEMLSRKNASHMVMTVFRTHASDENYMTPTLLAQGGKGRFTRLYEKCIYKLQLELSYTFVQSDATARFIYTLGLCN